MAKNVRLGLTVDLGDLGKDLDSVEVGLSKVLKAALERAGETTARATAGLFPVGPGPQSAKDNLPHMNETLSGVGYQTTAAVVSSHPGAPVVNYGGHIAPRGVEIFFPFKLYAQTAYEQIQPTIEARLQGDVDDIASRYFPG